MRRLARFSTRTGNAILSDIILVQNEAKPVQLYFRSPTMQRVLMSSVHEMIFQLCQSGNGSLTQNAIFMLL